MSNMSYCRFQNTLEDLRVCLGVLKDPEEVAKLSYQEAHCARVMLNDIVTDLTELGIIDGDTGTIVEGSIEDIFEAPGDEEEE